LIAVSHGLESLPLTGAPAATGRQEARARRGAVALRLRAAAAAMCLFSGAVLAIDAFLVEPNWI